MNTNKRSDCSHCPFLSPSLPLTSDFKGLYGDYLPWASKIYSSSVKMGCAASLMGNRPWTAEDFEKYDQIKQMWAKMDADGSGYIEIRYNVLTSARKAIPNRSLDAGNSNFRWTSLVVEKLEWTPSNSVCRSATHIVWLMLVVDTGGKYQRSKRWIRTRAARSRLMSK